MAPPFPVIFHEVLGAKWGGFRGNWTALLEKNRRGMADETPAPDRELLQTSGAFLGLQTAPGETPLRGFFGSNNRTFGAEAGSAGPENGRLTTAKGGGFSCPFCANFFAGPGWNPNVSVAEALMGGRRNGSFFGRFGPRSAAFFATKNLFSGPVFDGCGTHFHRLTDSILTAGSGKFSLVAGPAGRVVHGENSTFSSSRKMRILRRNALVKRQFGRAV